MNPRRGLAAIIAGMVASALMQTMLSVAAPSLVADLGGEALYPWVAGAYLVASLVALLFLAPVVDRIGPRTVFVAGFAVHLAGTVALGLAATMGAVIAARAVQGAGAGAIVPAGLAALGLMFDEGSRGRAIGAAGVAQVVATAAGPLWGGWATDGPGWRVGLLVAVPFLLAGLCLAAWLPTRARPAGWWRVAPWASLLLLRERRLAVLVLAAALAGAVPLLLGTYVPLRLQAVDGLGATEVGRHLLALLVGSGAGAALAGRVATRVWLLPAAWATTSLGLAGVLTGAGRGLVPGLAAAGVGTGAALARLLVVAQVDVPEDELAQRSGMLQLGRVAGPALAVPALGLWLGAGLPLAVSLQAILASTAVLAVAGLLLTLVPLEEP